MSIRDFINKDGALEFDSYKMNKATIGSHTHEEVGGNYTITNKNNSVLLNFDSSANLQNSVIKTYCDNILETVNELNDANTSTIGDLQTQINSINTSLETINANLVPENIDVSNLQQRIIILENQMTNILQYQLNLKNFFDKFKNVVSFSQPDNTNFDFSNLL